MKSIVWLLILFTPMQGQNAIGNGCPSNWIRLRDTDRCFYISDYNATFYVAKKYCESENSQLTPILSSYEEVDLSSALVAKRGKCGSDGDCLEYWVGVHDLHGTNEWTSTKDVPVEKSRLLWAPGFPKAHAGRCGLMSFHDNRKRGNLRNDNCEKQLKFACIICPDGFDYLPEINECLYFNTELKSWANARKTCSKLKSGAHLLTIGDKLKQEAVRRYLQQQFTRKESDACIPTEWTSGGKIVWLGGQTRDPKKCDSSSYVWKHLAGNAGTPFTYTNWYPRKPDCLNNGENCAILGNSPEYNYRWEDHTCNSELCSVCEF